MSIMLRSGYSDFIGANALPYMEFVVQDTWESFKPRYEMLLNIKQMQGSIAQSSQMSSFQAAGQVGEAEQVPLQKMYQGFDKTYTAVKYGLMTATSEELIKDQRFDLFGDKAKKLAKAIMQTVETVSANMFNNAFSTAQADGQALCSAAHPLLVPGSGTASNLLSTPADLSASSLKAMITLLRQTVDTAGNKIQIDPAMLLVHPDNEFLAAELIKSGYLPQSDNSFVNSINSISSEYRIQPVVWDFLTDADAFFVLAKPEDHNLCFWWRDRPEVSSAEDFKSGVMLTKILARFDVGASDWRGIVGTPGAT